MQPEWIRASLAPLPYLVRCSFDKISMRTGGELVSGSWMPGGMALASHLPALGGSKCLASAPSSTSSARDESVSAHSSLSRCRHPGT